MRVALVSTYSHPAALGLRYISACLKDHGHQVEVFFLSSRRETAKADFSPALLDELVERVRQAGLIGMSVMTNTFYRACALTEAIRGAGIKAPIVWGGVHPTVAPEECLEAADIVCVGEGERAAMELTRALETGGDPTNVGSLSFRRNGRIITNPVLPLGEHLDEYPFPDYELDTHWVAAKDHFEPARPRNLRGTLHRYRILTTRGCPFSCTFCTNEALRRIHEGKGKWVRKRSDENVIRELEQARARFPGIEAVNIVDDLFFVRSEAEMEAFSRTYQARVNLPLEVDASPGTITRAKTLTLARLPISLISMGIQSGSADTLNNIYDRHTPLDKIIDAINTFAEHNIRAEYHYLVNNPLEPDRNRIETLHFAADHHRGPAALRIFPLQLYPGTLLYNRARDQGLIKQHHESAYRATYTGKTHLHGSQYLDIWLRVVLNLRNWGVPSGPLHWLINCVTNRWVRRAIDRKWFGPLAWGLYRVGRFISRKLIYQPFVRPLRYLRPKARGQEPPTRDDAASTRRAAPQEKERTSVGVS